MQSREETGVGDEEWGERMEKKGNREHHTLRGRKRLSNIEVCRQNRERVTTSVRETQEPMVS